MRTNSPTSLLDFIRRRVGVGELASASWRRRVSVGELASASWLYLSIHIAESFETFAPVTVVQAVNVTGEYTNIYIGHISETHYVSTVEKRKCRVPNNKTCDQSIVEKKLINMKSAELIEVT